MISRTPSLILSRLVVVALAACLLFMLNIGTAETQTKSPYDKDRLLRVVRLNALSTPEIVRAVEQRGVNFQITPDVEAEFRDAGARPELIDALRKSYHPASASAPPRNPNQGNRRGETPSNVPGGPALAKNEIVTL